jgi:hypothetical protein
MSELTVQSKPTQFDLSPQTFEQALTFSNYLAESDMVPKDFKGKPGNCLVAIQWGMEIGLKPLQAMQNIAVINGRPSLWGDAVIALARNSPVCEYIVEDDDGKTATCRVKRRGEQEQVRVFSMEDAKTAGLLGKQGPWTQYPKRMRQMRARAFAIRDVFPDVLKGLAVAEEVMDIPNGEPKPMGMAEVVTPEPKQEAAPVWPDDVFKKKLPTFLKAIADGKTADDIIAWAKTKGTLTAEQEATIRKPADEIVMTYAQVADKITKATDMDKLSEAASLIAAVQDATQREELTVMSERRADELDATELK